MLTHTQSSLSYFSPCSPTPLQNVYLSSDSTHRVCRATVAPFQQQQCLCVCVCVCARILAYMDGCVFVCVKSWGVCLQCWELHLHTLTCVQSLSSVQFKLTQLSWRSSDWLRVDFCQPNVSFALNLIIDSVARKHSLKSLSVESDCTFARFYFPPSLHPANRFFPIETII